MEQYCNNTFHSVNNKDVDRLCRLVCAFVVRMQQLGFNHVNAKMKQMAGKVLHFWKVQV